MECTALKGGHGVPLKDVIRRYERSLCHIPKLMSLTDYMLVLDNSKNYEQVLESNRRAITIKKALPTWLEAIFDARLKTKAQTISEP